MLSSKASGWSLTIGFVTLVILMVASMLESDHDTRAEEVAWAATNNDW
jgi:hypothetical protein